MGSMMYFDSIDHIRQSGFEGFETVGVLRESKCRYVSDKFGVYLVLRPNTTRPCFLDESKGGHFKGRNPTVAIKALEDKWVDDALVLNIGKAGPREKRTLKCRLTEYIQFGEGRAVGHQGGRYVWQLRNSDDLLLCWKETPNDVPRNVEKELIREFKAAYRRLPFANLRH